MDDGVGLVAWLTLELILIQTGRVVVTLLTLGRWRGEHTRKSEGRIHAPAGALSFVHDGRRVITTNGLLFVGLGFYVVLGFLIAYIASH